MFPLHEQCDYTNHFLLPPAGNSLQQLLEISSNRQSLLMPPLVFLCRIKETEYAKNSLIKQNYTKPGSYPQSSRSPFPLCVYTQIPAGFSWKFFLLNVFSAISAFAPCPKLSPLNKATGQILHQCRVSSSDKPRVK